MSNFDDANVDKDLLNQIFADGDEEQEEIETSSEDMPEVSETEPVEEIVEMPEEVPSEEAFEEIPVQEEEMMPESFEQEEVEPIDDIVREEAEQEMDAERQKGTVTVITKGTTINGGISSDGSLEVMGVITGDVDCQGKVSINGQVSGSVSAQEIYVNTPRLGGNLNSNGTVKIGVGTVVIGDITASSAYIAGAIKGKIDVNGPVVVDSTAIVKGDIKAKSIQVNNGAVVDGYCSLNYAGVDLDSFFEEK